MELKIAKGVSFIKSSFLTSGECDPQMSRLSHLLTDNQAAISYTMRTVGQEPTGTLQEKLHY